MTPPEDDWSPLDDYRANQTAPAYPPPDDWHHPGAAGGPAEEDRS